jgi:interleukin-1 receptor-associated kinase 1
MNLFSTTENFVGEGGCSNVYKGCLPGGKQVAVKILKQYKEAWSDFSLEIDIMSSLKHKHITPLLGICVEDNHLILVYDFLSRGSLDERLQGKYL